MGQSTPLRKRDALVYPRCCAYCCARRQGESLFRHCMDKHDGQNVITVKVRDAEELRRAATLLRDNGFTVFPDAAFKNLKSIPIEKGGPQSKTNNP